MSHAEHLGKLLYLLLVIAYALALLFAVINRVDEQTIFKVTTSALQAWIAITGASLGILGGLLALFVLLKDHKPLFVTLSHLLLLLAAFFVTMAIGMWASTDWSFGLATNLFKTEFAVEIVSQGLWIICLLFGGIPSHHHGYSTLP